MATFNRSTDCEPADALLAANTIAATVEELSAMARSERMRQDDILDATLTRLDRSKAAADAKAAHYIRWIMRKERSSFSTRS